MSEMDLFCEMLTNASVKHQKFKTTTLTGLVEFQVDVFNKDKGDEHCCSQWNFDSHGSLLGVHHWA